MGFWLLMTAVSTAAATPLLAPPVVAKPDVAPRAKLNLRFVDQPEMEPQRVRRSGMIVETAVAPNAALGVGLFKISARRFGSIERTEVRRNSRKVGVNFHLHF